MESMGSRVEGVEGVGGVEGQGEGVGGRGVQRGGGAEEDRSGLGLDGGLNGGGRAWGRGGIRASRNLSRLLWGVMEVVWGVKEVGGGMSAVAGEALSAGNSGISVIRTGIVSPKNGAVTHKGVNMLTGRSGEGGGGGESSFLNADINLTGEFDVAHVEMRGGNGFGRNILPGHCNAFELQPVGAHVIGDVKERQEVKAGHNPLGLKRQQLRHAKFGCRVTVYIFQNA